MVCRVLTDLWSEIVLSFVGLLVPLEEGSTGNISPNIRSRMKKSRDSNVLGRTEQIGRRYMMGSLLEPGMGCLLL